MPTGVKINLDNELIRLLDELRGDLDRDEFISQILNEHLMPKSGAEVVEDDFIDLEAEASAKEQNIKMFIERAVLIVKRNPFGNGVFNLVSNTLIHPIQVERIGDITKNG